MTSTLAPYKNIFLQKSDINNSSLYSFKQIIQNPFHFNTPYSVSTSLYNLLALQNTNTKNPNNCILNSPNLDSNDESTVQKPQNVFISKPAKIQFENKSIIVVSSNSESEISENYSSATSRRSSFSQNSPKKRLNKNELSPEMLTDGVTIKRSLFKNNTHKNKKCMIRDDAYWERRRRNNDAAKRSRDSRRKKVRIKIDCEVLSYSFLRYYFLL
uniref:BZIP domain-containing protein n=1 Tax=Strongyloides venezuelensis TaxID=75913 RepID=A0A0K0FL40_STRVS